MLIFQFDANRFYSDDSDPESYIYHYSGKISMYLSDLGIKEEEDDDDGVQEIGIFRIQIIDVLGAQRVDIDPFHVFDTTQALYDCFVNLYDPLTSEPRKDVQRALGSDYTLWDQNPNLLILDHIGIHPRYRGRGFGLAALRALILRFRHCAGIIAIRPIPLRFEADADNLSEVEYHAFSNDYSSAVVKLRTYYKRLGFKVIRRRDLDQQFMVLYSGAALPPIQDLLSNQSLPGTDRAG